MFAAYRQWIDVQDGIQAGSGWYKAAGWDKERRVCVSRQKEGQKQQAKF